MNSNRNVILLTINKEEKTISFVTARYTWKQQCIQSLPTIDQNMKRNMRLNVSAWAGAWRAEAWRCRGPKVMRLLGRHVVETFLHSGFLHMFVALCVSYYIFCWQVNSYLHACHMVFAVRKLSLCSVFSFFYSFSLFC